MLFDNYIIQVNPRSYKVEVITYCLRNKPSVVVFRSYLSKIEMAIDEGHWNVLMGFERDITEIVGQIFNETGVRDAVTIEILPLPSLSIGFGTIKNIRKYIQLNFLRELGRFAYRERKMKM